MCRKGERPSPLDKMLAPIRAIVSTISTPPAFLEAGSATGQPIGVNLDADPTAQGVKVHAETPGLRSLLLMKLVRP
jgi:hypothetical protein